MQDRGYGSDWTVDPNRLLEAERFPLRQDEWFRDGGACDTPADVARATRRRRVTRRKGRDRYEQILHKHAAEDERRKKVDRKLLPVLSKLNQAGDTELSPDEFRVFTGYLFAELPTELRRHNRRGVVVLANGSRVKRLDRVEVAA